MLFPSPPPLFSKAALRPVSTFPLNASLIPQDERPCSDGRPHPARAEGHSFAKQESPPPRFRPPTESDLSAVTPPPGYRLAGFAVSQAPVPEGARCGRSLPTPPPLSVSALPHLPLQRPATFAFHLTTYHRLLQVRLRQRRLDCRPHRRRHGAVGPDGPPNCWGPENDSPGPASAISNGGGSGESMAAAPSRCLRRRQRRQRGPQERGRWRGRPERGRQHGRAQYHANSAAARPKHDTNAFTACAAPSPATADGGGGRGCRPCSGHEHRCVDGIGPLSAPCALFSAQRRAYSEVAARKRPVAPTVAARRRRCSIAAGSTSIALGSGRCRRWRRRRHRRRSGVIQAARGCLSARRPVDFGESVEW